MSPSFSIFTDSFGMPCTTSSFMETQSVAGYGARALGRVAEKARLVAAVADEPLRHVIKHLRRNTGGDFGAKRIKHDRKALPRFDKIRPLGVIRNGHLLVSAARMSIAIFSGVCSPFISTSVPALRNRSITRFGVFIVFLQACINRGIICTAFNLFTECEAAANLLIRHANIKNEEWSREPCERFNNNLRFRHLAIESVKYGARVAGSEKILSDRGKSRASAA